MHTFFNKRRNLVELHKHWGAQENKFHKCQSLDENLGFRASNIDTFRGTIQQILRRNNNRKSIWVVDLVELFDRDLGFQLNLGIWGLVIEWVYG